MVFQTEEDNATVREIVDFEVARRGLDQLDLVEGLDLIQNLVRNRKKIAPERWLHWLTDGRQLIRLANLIADARWIGSLPFSRDERTALAAQTYMPVCTNGDAWIVAAIKRDTARRARFEALWRVRIVEVAPTLDEIAALFPHYGRTL